MKRLASVVAAVLIGAASLAVTASPAHAFPTGCSLWYDYYGGTERGLTYCSGGTGIHRAVVRCDINNWPDYNVYGGWRSPGGTSIAACNIGHRAYNLSIEFGY